MHSMQPCAQASRALCVQGQGCTKHKTEHLWQLQLQAGSSDTNSRQRPPIRAIQGRELPRASRDPPAQRRRSLQWPEFSSRSRCASCAYSCSTPLPMHEDCWPALDGICTRCMPWQAQVQTAARQHILLGGHCPAWSP